MSLCQFSSNQNDIFLNNNEINITKNDRKFIIYENRILRKKISYVNIIRLQPSTFNSLFGIFAS